MTPEDKKPLIPIIKSGVKAAGKGLLSELPGTGILIESMNEAANRANKRQIDFLKAAYAAQSERLEGLEKQLASNTKLADFWYESSEIASQASNTDKQALFVGILTDLTNRTISITTADLFRRLVTNLTSDHIKVLNALKLHADNSPNLQIGGIIGYAGMADNEIAADVKTDQHIITILLADLSQSNLIVNIPSHSFTGAEPSNRYKLSDFGTEFIASIQRDSPND